MHIYLMLIAAHGQKKSAHLINWHEGGGANESEALNVERRRQKPQEGLVGRDLAGEIKQGQWCLWAFIHFDLSFLKERIRKCIFMELIKCLKGEK